MPQTPFLTTLYRLLLRLYPRPFRQEFAAEMQHVFAALVSETAQQRGQPFLRLCLREFGGLLIGIGKEWLLMLSQKMQYFSRPQFTRPVTPAPWAEVLLTIFPGLVFIIGEWYVFLNQLPQPDIWYPGTFGTVLNALLPGWFLVVVLRVVVRQRFDGAALALLGLMTALLIALPEVLFSLNGVTVLVAIIGLLAGGAVLARSHGAHAFLFLLVMPSFVMEVGDPAYALRFSHGSTVIVPVVETLPLFGCLILVPVLLLRARSVAGQVGGTGLAFLGTTWLATALGTLLPADRPLALLLFQSVVLLCLTIFFVAVTWSYAWLAASSSPQAAHGEAEHP